MIAPLIGLATWLKLAGGSTLLLMAFWQYLLALDDDS